MKKMKNTFSHKLDNLTSSLMSHTARFSRRHLYLADLADFDPVELFFVHDDEQTLELNNPIEDLYCSNELPIFKYSMDFSRNQ